MNGVPWSFVDFANMSWSIDGPAAMASSVSVCPVRVHLVGAPVAMMTVPFSWPPPGPGMTSMLIPSRMTMSPLRFAVSKGFKISENVKLVPDPVQSQPVRTVPTGWCTTRNRAGDTMP